eukprot:COSAG05_NODE_379_length_10567_cov_18.553687_5_plen_80_part_00
MVTSVTNAKQIWHFCGNGQVQLGADFAPAPDVRRKVGPDIVQCRVKWRFVVILLSHIVHAPVTKCAVVQRPCMHVGHGY